ncbi:MAG: response regulator [Anaerolineales bacterium]|nr:response regulator [Anaerolineales bacterium]
MADEKIRVLIVDDIAETRENIRKLLQFDADVEVVGAARTGSEGIQLALETEPDVVLMDINMPDMDGIAATEQIRSRQPFTQIVILSVQSDSNYMRRAMLAGARDFLTKPPDIDELTNAIQRAGAMAAEEKAKRSSAPPSGSAQRPGTGGFTGPSFGKIISIYGPKGGVGTTTITANLGVALHSEETPVAVVDGKLQYGDLSFFFNEQGKNNITILAPRSDELDNEIVEEVMVVHANSGVHILAAPQRPEQAEGVAGGDFSRVLEFLRKKYAYILVDTSSFLNDISLSIFDTMDLIVLITTQDIPSIKNVRLFLDLANALGISRNKVSLVMNRFDKRRSITPEKVSENFKQNFAAVVPLEERLVVPAMDRGVPFMLQNDANPVTRSISELAKKVEEQIRKLAEAEAEAV